MNLTKEDTRNIVGDMLLNSLKVFNKSLAI